MTDRSPDRLLRLAGSSIRNYRSMLAAAERGASGFNVVELRALIAAWEGVERAEGDVAKLTPVERSEVEDELRSLEEDAYEPPTDAAGEAALDVFIDPLTGDTITVADARVKLAGIIGDKR